MPAIDHFPDWNKIRRESLSSRDPAVREALADRLRDAFYIVCVTLPQTDSGEKTAQRMIATANTGARLLTFFTSEDRIPEDDDSDTTTVTFQELAEELRACTSFAGVVINPSGDSLDNALVMSRGDVFRIAGIEDSGATRGGDSYKIAARVHMHYTFSAPDQVQFRLVSDLHSALRKFPDIRDVYYLTAHSDNAEAPIPFFAVDFDGDEDSVHNTVSDVIGRHFNRTVFTVVKTDDVLLKIARAKGLSVYSRAG